MDAPARADAILTAQDLTVAYGRNNTVIHGLSLSLVRNRVCALLGANGAGKSTLLGALAGRLSTQRGRIVFKGEDVTRASMADRVVKGLVLVPQGRQLFPEMSVAENLQLGGYRRRGADLGERIEESAESFPVLKRRWKQTAGSLSGGEQQMLAVARGLVGRPSLMLLDEPSLGIAPQIRREMLRALGEICRTRELTVLIAEQDVQLAIDAAEDAHVLQFGQLVLSAAASPDLMNDERLRRAYIGR